MKNTKLILILGSLSKAEFKEFEKFTASPFFSRGRNLIPLLKEIKKYYPGFDNKNFTKQKIFARLYESEYNDKLMRTLMSDLLKMCEDYLTHISLKKYPFLNNSHLAYEAIFRRLNTVSESSIKKAGEELNEYGIDSHYFRFCSFVDIAKVAYNLSTDKQILASGDVKNSAANTVYSFIASASRALHNLAANKYAFNIDYEDHLFLNFVKCIDLERFLTESGNYDLKDVISLYIHAILTLVNLDDEIHYRKMKELIFLHIEKFNLGEQYHLLSVLQAACAIKTYRINRDKFMSEHFEILNFILKRNQHKYSGDVYFPLIRFVAFFNLGVQLKKVSWLEEYLEKYISEVSPEFTENIQKLCRGQINFLKGRYDEALENIINIDFNIFMLKYDIKTLILKIYYEMDYIEEAHSALDSYRHFLLNNQNVSEPFRVTNNNFLLYYHKLQKKKYEKSAIKGHEMVQEIRNINAITEKSWLLEKAAELE